MNHNSGYSPLSYANIYRFDSLKERLFSFKEGVIVNLRCQLHWVWNNLGTCFWPCSWKHFQRSRRIRKHPSTWAALSKDWSLRMNTKGTMENMNQTTFILFFFFFPAYIVCSASSPPWSHSSLSWWTVLLQPWTHLKCSFLK